VLAGLALVAALAALPSSPASAAKHGSQQCAAGNRWCTFVLVRDDRYSFLIAGRGLVGSYRLCVTAPAARTERCREFRLLGPNAVDAYESRVSFTGNFPHARHGRYAVRWLYGGRQLGKVLHFSA
jgi:hypothetical protein